MKKEDFDKLLSMLKNEIAKRPPGTRIALAGRTSTAFDLASFLALPYVAVEFLGIYELRNATDPADSPNHVKSIGNLAVESPDIVVITEDEGKEQLLEAVAAVVPPSTRLLISGFGHFTLSR